MSSDQAQTCNRLYKLLASLHLRNETACPAEEVKEKIPQSVVAIREQAYEAVNCTPESVGAVVRCGTQVMVCVGVFGFGPRRPCQAKQYISKQPDADHVDHL